MAKADFWMFFVVFVLVATVAKGAVTCGQVCTAFRPCLGYISYKVPKPPPACCKGMLSQEKIWRSRADYVEACKCLKTALENKKDCDPSLIPLISKKCGLSFHLPAIGKDTDCNKVVPPGF